MLSPVTMRTFIPHFFNCKTESGTPGLSGSFNPVIPINIRFSPYKSGSFKLTFPEISRYAKSIFLKDWAENLDIYLLILNLWSTESLTTCPFSSIYMEQILKRYSGAPYKLIIYNEYSTFDINPIATFIPDESCHTLGPVIEWDTFYLISIISEVLVAHVQNSVH